MSDNIAAAIDALVNERPNEFRDVINKFNPFYKKTSDLGESESRKIFGLYQSACWI